MISSHYDYNILATFKISYFKMLYVNNLFELFISFVFLDTEKETKLPFFIPP